MKTATKASAAKSKKSTSMQIRFPTNDVWTKLVKDLDLRVIEEETAPLRQTFGLRHCHVLLTSLIVQWHAEIEKQLVLERLNKGGRKVQLDRKYLLHCLALAAPRIINREAAVAVTGPFIRLCEAVLPACGLPSVGVDKVVPEIVREIRDRQKNIPKFAP